MLDRFLNILLLILVVIAFFFGVRVGKNIQRVDTPERIVYKTKKPVPLLTQLNRYSLSSCNYSFVIPDTLKIKSSSQSAVITDNDDTVSVACAQTTPTETTSSYIQLPGGKYIILNGEQTLLNSIKEGFVTDVRYKILP